MGMIYNVFDRELWQMPFDLDWVDFANSEANPALKRLDSLCLMSSSLSQWFSYWDILEVVWRLWSAVKGSGSTKSSISPFTIYYLTRTPRISWKMRINSQICCFLPCHQLPITRSWRWGLTRRSRRWLLGTRASRSCWRCSRTRERVRWNDVKNKEERKNNAEESWLRERRTMLKRKYYFFKRWN